MIGRPKMLQARAHILAEIVGDRDTDDVVAGWETDGWVERDWREAVEAELRWASTGVNGPVRDRFVSIAALALGALETLFPEEWDYGGAG